MSAAVPFTRLRHATHAKPFSGMLVDDNGSNESEIHFKPFRIKPQTNPNSRSCENVESLSESGTKAVFFFARPENEIWSRQYLSQRILQQQAPELEESRFGSIGINVGHAALREAYSQAMGNKPVFPKFLGIDKHKKLRVFLYAYGTAELFDSLNLVESQEDVIDQTDGCGRPRWQYYCDSEVQIWNIQELPGNHYEALECAFLFPSSWPDDRFWTLQASLVTLDDLSEKHAESLCIPALRPGAIHRQPCKFRPDDDLQNRLKEQQLARSHILPFWTNQ